MRNWPEIVRDPVFTPVVFAMNPWSAVTVPSRWLYAVSLYRHRWPTRPIGHFIASHGGAAVSLPVRFPLPPPRRGYWGPGVLPFHARPWGVTAETLDPAAGPFEP